MTTAEQMHAHGPIADVPPGFVDAVMRSVAAAPTPSPSRAFTSALRDRSTSEAQGALSVAWRLFRAGATMPVLVRAQALALLLLVGGSMVGAGTIAAVATYQTVVPIVRSVVDPAADDGGITIPALAEPSPEPTPSPTPKPAVAPPDHADVRDTAEPMSEDGDADTAPRDDAADDDTDEPEPDDPDSDAETDEPDDDSGRTDDDPDEGMLEPEIDSEDASDRSDDGDPEDAEANDPDDSEPGDSDHRESDEPDDGEPDEPDDGEPDDPDQDD